MLTTSLFKAQKISLYKMCQSMKMVILLLLAGGPLFGQNVDYNKVIYPESSQSLAFEEKLIQLAWRNHPDNEILRRQVNIAGYTVNQSNAAWLDNIRITGNLNEFTLNKQADPFGRANLYPKYNISASITLGTFFNVPYTIKKDKEALIISQANVNAQKLAVRNTVLKLYNEYVMRERIYKVQSQALLDNETSHKLAEQRFKRGEITFEMYATSLTSYNGIMISQLQAERDYKNATLDLEQWIGMKLVDVR